MTLTVVVGSSGSGKTTFLNHVHESHRCTYIRQYHNLRPYIVVDTITKFDPTGLPYWEIYENEDKASTIRVGGTMAGEFTAGLSGGQRKLLLFELIFQRFQNQHDLLVVFDEPFAGVTDDFVPFIVKRLNDLRENHNILLVTNDHVETLKEMADNTITVSAIDRTTVKINDREKVDREKVILALSVGDEYEYQATWQDLSFFVNVEVLTNPALITVVIFTIFTHLLFLLTFWGSDRDNAPLVVVAANIIAFFCLQPYLLSLVDWRNAMSQEADALLHASKSMNKFLKTVLTLTLLLAISGLSFGTLNLVIDGMEAAQFWVGMLMDSASLTFPFVCLGLYTKLTFEAVGVLAGMPFLMMIFFSTTFSPGSGIEGLKALRYLFSRFYLWCMMPQVNDLMEGCPTPDSANLLYCVLAGISVVVVFLFYQGVVKLIQGKKKKAAESKQESLRDEEFLELQVELYGERAKELQASRHSRDGSKHGKK